MRWGGLSFRMAREALIDGIITIEGRFGLDQIGPGVQNLVRIYFQALHLCILEDQLKERSPIFQLGNTILGFRLPRKLTTPQEADEVRVNNSKSAGMLCLDSKTSKL